MIYLDDVSVGWSVEDVLHDLDVIKKADSLGLTLNTSKCVIIGQKDTVWGNLIGTLPGANIVSLKRACLLGSLLGCVASIDASLEKKIKTLKTMYARFKFLLALDALTLLFHSFAVSKLHHLLRTAPCFLCRQFGRV